MNLIMSTMDLPNIPGFLSDHILTSRGYEAYWRSRFSTLEIQASGPGYRITHDYASSFKGAYYDTLEEAVYHVRYRAINKFFGDDIF